MDITTPNIVKDSSPQRNQQPGAKAHRPRSTTESGPRRYVSMDYQNRETDEKSGLGTLGIKPIGNPSKNPFFSNHQVALWFIFLKSKCI